MSAIMDEIVTDPSSNHDQVNHDQVNHDQSQRQAMAKHSDATEPDECRVCGQSAGDSSINIFDVIPPDTVGDTGSAKPKVLWADKIALAFATVVSI